MTVQFVVHSVDLRGSLCDSYSAEAATRQPMRRAGIMTRAVATGCKCADPGGSMEGESAGTVWEGEADVGEGEGEGEEEGRGGTEVVDGGTEVGGVVVVVREQLPDMSAGQLACRGGCTCMWTPLNIFFKLHAVSVHGTYSQLLAGGEEVLQTAGRLHIRVLGPAQGTTVRCVGSCSIAVSCSFVRWYLKTLCPQQPVWSSVCWQTGEQVLVTSSHTVLS